MEETTFLGVIFDRKVSFIPHLKYVKKKVLKALNISKVIGNTEWGADRKVMLRLYRSLIRSKLDYGCIVYGSARKSYLRMLDPIHNQGLRLCLGAFRTSPVESLYVDAIYQQPFMEIRDRYRDYIPVYTDGSRDGNSVACATVVPSNSTFSMRLPDSASIFTAEIWAIIKALEFFFNASASKFIIFTDSLSCLQALLYMKLEHPLIGMAIRKCVFLNIANKNIILCWVPSHVGIRGKEKADSRLVYLTLILNI